MVTVKKKQSAQQQLYGIEYKHVYTLRVVYLIITGLLFLLLSFIVVFIYRNVFQALDEANVIVVLQSDLQMKTINFERLAEVEHDWIARQEMPAVIANENPFFPAAVASSTPPVTATSTPPAEPEPVVDSSTDQPNIDSL